MTSVRIAAVTALLTTLADGTKAYEDAAVDLSGQTAGSSLLWRVRTANTKNIEVHGVYVQGR